ncbi:MAG: endonuclease III [Defluviitaleaceae bacterium]|nr:endonuclease III [Defluviitaleaceae bacterium]
MDKKERKFSEVNKKTVEQILSALDVMYPFDFTCFLNYEREKPWQLLIATILSAQCTDDRVNLVTKDLFCKYPGLEAFAQADYAELSEDIRSTGFYRVKAKNIMESAHQLLVKHHGELPSDIDSLTLLPGVGRKTANVVRGHIFQIPSIVVDTHVKRVTFKLGLTQFTDPEKIEFELMEILPESHWIAYNQQIITHGRRICTARSPKCEQCSLSEWCKAFLLK